VTANGNPHRSIQMYLFDGEIYFCNQRLDDRLPNIDYPTNKPPTSAPSIPRWMITGHRTKAGRCKHYYDDPIFAGHVNSPSNAVASQKSANFCFDYDNSLLDRHLQTGQ
jgi:hypothetical protein